MNARPAPPTGPDAPGALDGVRVVDFTRLFAGPICTMVLADLGADVIKIEPPTGDEARLFGPPFLGGEGMNYMALNRGKRSVVLDMKSAHGVEAARELIRGADVVVENFRPGVTERLGIDYASSREVAPELVYCSITGFGSRGAYRDRPALDLILQGMAGVMHRQGFLHGLDPNLVVITIADTYAGSLAVQAILAALYARERGQGGQLVEVNLFQSLLFAQAYRMVTAADQVELSAWGDVCPYGPFRADDDWFNLAVVTERTWAAFCDAVDRPELRDDPRFKTNPDRVDHQGELVPLLNDVFSSRPVDHWLRKLEQAGVPCGPIVRVEDLFTDPHVVETQGIVELEHSSAGKVWTIGAPFSMAGTPLRVTTAAPLLGEQTDEIMAEVEPGLAESAASTPPAGERSP
jgi:crotonobetainyl-CoA:carnitine CoA-transferase CaiB-like acyl-CoA transferase